ncbi:SET and MYND domain-containing protein DDB_G0273589-like [Aphidius gifuensis]|uniref:SET and MYND domain-containing protein DDB_G0273589-like n=1 Tax=Aphidius gifuensis TaxID=684658 RepID=UPI001CDD393F|nr:SET and MYND domain-containing protein DDB_G0273589-like [Aphidius gifuensis]
MWQFINERAPDSHCDYLTEEKTVADSLSWRTTGNNEYKNSTNENYLSKSIKAYTKSIAYAPLGSSELSLAYANRSAALFKARLYQDCLLDIERALKSGYPDELKTKLFLRQALSFKALDRSFNIKLSDSMANAKKWLPNLKKNCPYYNIKAECSKMMNQLGEPLDTNTVKFTPTIKNNNSIIAGGSDAIELKKTNDNKQHIVATRDIKSGEFIYINKSFEMIACDDDRYMTCWHCCRQTWAGVPCDECPNVVFCSPECKDSAWNEYHDIECPVLSYSKKVQHHPENDWQFQLTIKILSKALKAAGGIAQLKQKIDDVDSMEDKSMIYTDGIFNVNTIDNFHRLKYDKSAFDHCSFEQTTHIVSLVLMFGLNTNFFGQKMEVDDTCSNEDPLALGFLIARYFMIVNYNVVYVTDKMSHNTVFTHALIMPIQNMFVRDCHNHIDWYDYGQNVAVAAERPIKKGEEIKMFAIGIYEAKQLSKDGTRLAKFVKEPLCKCSACVKDLPALEVLPSYKSLKLSKKVRKELNRIMREAHDYFYFITERDTEKMLEIKDTLAELTDKIYGHITGPCQETCLFQDKLGSLHQQLSSPRRIIQ